jgi:magnesium transporter
MMHVYVARDGALQQVEVGPVGLPENGVWIDLNHPTREEEKLLEGWLGINVPTREEMQEIEASSRLYEENGALFMTTTLVWRADTEQPANTPVTFIVTPRHLVTVRYAEPQAFKNFMLRCTKQPKMVMSSDSAFIGLLEAVVDRAADILERIGAELDGVSAEIFHEQEKRALKTGRRVRHRPADLEHIIVRIGRNSDLATKVRESLLSLGRTVSFFRDAAEEWTQPAMRVHLKTLVRDVRSLTEHDTYVVSKVNFLLDATLGLINIQQNAIIKIFSVAAVVFMPPTLVASIYGMNFKHMPELEFPFGYPMAIVIMICSAIFPYLYFKYRRWL